MTDPQKLIDLDLENRLTPEQAEEIQRRIKGDPDFARLFVRTSLLSSFIRNEFVEADLKQSMASLPSLDVAHSALGDTGQAATESIIVADAEEVAKAQEVEAYARRQLQRFLEEEQRERETQTRASRQVRSTLGVRAAGWALIYKMGALVSLSARATVVAAAVLALMLVIGGIAKTIQSHRVVAVVGSTLEAQWDRPLDGNDLHPGSLRLDRGYAQLTFKRGAQILLQAPCELELVNPNRMRIITGSLTATVPKSALGFTVDTPSAQVEDYGTQFGIAVNGSLQAEIHVFKGEVGLRSVHKSHRSKLQFVQMGLAARADLLGDIQVGSLNERPRLFMHEMPSSNSGGMPGVRLDLADVVGGGNGFGSGQLGGRQDCQGTINPLTAQLNDAWRPDESHHRRALHVAYPMRYTPNHNHPYIDGTLIPDGGQGPCIVSSVGHIFEECPDTDGWMKWNIVNGWKYACDPIGPKNSQALIDGIGISMHANCAITFDLDQIREAMPGVDISGFSTSAGIPLLTEAEESESDIWILVDGKIRFQKNDVHCGQMFDVRFAIAPEERFFTLVATDSQSGPPDYWSLLDWCYFSQPTLLLTPAGRDPGTD